MPKGRGGIILLAFLIAFILLAVWLIRRGGLNLMGAQQQELPIDLKNIIPSSWKLLPSPSEPCNFDDDDDNEWLLLYSYDPTSTLNVYSAAGNPLWRNPIGGVIYDAQVNRGPQEPGNVSPYRPALLVPYKLLPDYYTGKGQGYLGETDVIFRSYAPPVETEEAAALCRAEELYFLGYSYEPLPTRLSIFRWESRDVGYKGVHFIGNAHVDAPGTIDVTQPITQVTTYNHLDNHRSLLCEVKHFTRQGELKELYFPPDDSQFTIDFCYGTPNDPAYPEAVLIALLRGGKPPAAGSPTGASFLTKNAELDPRLSSLHTGSPTPFRILSVTNQGTVAPSPGQGAECEPAALEPSGESGDKWWCAAENAYAQAEIVLEGRVYLAVAQLISIANERVTASVHWRVMSLMLQ